MSDSWECLHKSSPWVTRGIFSLLLSKSHNDPPTGWTVYNHSYTLYRLCRTIVQQRVLMIDLACGVGQAIWYNCETLRKDTEMASESISESLKSKTFRQEHVPWSLHASFAHSSLAPPPPPLTNILELTLWKPPLEISGYTTEIQPTSTKSQHNNGRVCQLLLALFSQKLQALASWCRFRVALDNSWAHHWSHWSGCYSIRGVGYFWFKKAPLWILAHWDKQ